METMVEDDEADSEGPALAVLASDTAKLVSDRTEAAARADRPMGGRMSQEAHLALDTADVEEESTAVRPVRRSVAAAIGTAVHSLLEELDLGAPLAPQVEHCRVVIRERLCEGLEGVDHEQVRQRFDDLVDGLTRSECLRRLETIAPRVVARELPLLAAPGGASDAVGFAAGAADLLYREADGTLVVADFKTDAVTDGAELDARAEVYRPQIEAYAGALIDAFDLDVPPRCELWFLSADRIVVAD